MTSWVYKIRAWSWYINATAGRTNRGITYDSNTVLWTTTQNGKQYIISDAFGLTDRSASRSVSTSSSAERNRSCWSCGQRSVKPGTDAAHCLMTSIDCSSRTAHRRRQNCSEPLTPFNEMSTSLYCSYKAIDKCAAISGAYLRPFLSYGDLHVLKIANFPYTPSYLKPSIGPGVTPFGFRETLKILTYLWGADSKDFCDAIDCVVLTQ